MGGPFVMNTQEEIDATYQDYKNGKNGFEKAIGSVGSQHSPKKL